MLLAGAAGFPLFLAQADHVGERIATAKHTKCIYALNRII